MSSTVNSTPTGNSASGNAVNTSQNPNGRTSLRPSASTRVPDNRRQSPVDGGTRYVVHLFYQMFLELSIPSLPLFPILDPQYTPLAIKRLREGEGHWTQSTEWIFSLPSSLVSYRTLDFVYRGPFFTSSIGDRRWDGCLNGSFLCDVVHVG